MKPATLAVLANLTLLNPIHAEELPMTPSFITNSQGRLAIYEQGSGQGLPVLFLHADSGIAGQWAEVLPMIAGDRRVTALDSRGSGASAEARDGDYSYDGRASDIAAVAEARKLDRFVIVAHSGSGAAALRYAARNKERVAGLFLLDPATDPRVIPKDIREGIVSGLAGPESLDFQKQFYATIAGPDAKVLAVPFGDPRWDHLVDLGDIPTVLKAEIHHFFEAYKHLEPAKGADVQGWKDVDSAWEAIVAARAAFRATH